MEYGFIDDSFGYRKLIFKYTFMVRVGPLFMTKMSKKGRVLLISTSVENFMVGLRLLRWRKIVAVFLVHVASPQRYHRHIRAI
jgi:hypothetical protein